MNSIEYFNFFSFTVVWPYIDKNCTLTILTILCVKVLVSEAEEKARLVCEKLNKILFFKKNHFSYSNLIYPQQSSTDQRIAKLPHTKNLPTTFIIIKNQFIILV